MAALLITDVYSMSFPGLFASRADCDAELDDILDKRGSHSRQSQFGRDHSAHHVDSGHSKYSPE